MEEIEPRLPSALAISYLPRLDGIWLELSLRSQLAEAEAATSLLDEAVEIVAHHFRDKLYARGVRSLPELLAGLFQAKQLSLAVAESLTGGQLSAGIVSVSGVSSFYKGSVTAYATPVKIQLLRVDAEVIDRYSVVSGPVAEQMAEGVRKLLGADIGLATTGLAEGDGDREAQAYIGYADRSGTTSRHVWGYGTRDVNIARAANAAMHLCLKKVQEGFA
jgi:nicotinamide-nucleotide amidase